MKTVSTSFFFRAAFLAGGIGFALLVGCQGQGEGERCSLLNANNDCIEPFICTAASSLKLEDGVNRCCPEEVSQVEDDRCSPRIGGGSGTGGSTGSGGSTGNAGGGGEGGTISGLGDECRYTSDCAEGLDCGPTGECQHECKDNIDCDDGLICTVDMRCVEP